MNQRVQAVQRIFGAIVALSSLISVPPLAIAWWLGESSFQAFFDSFAFTGVAGLVLWWPVRHTRYDLRLRDGFLVTASIWVIASLVAAIPFTLAEPYLSYTDAVFEAASGLTTTGATTIAGLDALPRSVLLYRQSLNFLGGMGIVILAVAIMPMLKVGGMQLFRAESTGPQKDSKLTPRIADTAKALWLVYAGLTVACGLAFWIGGMSGFDAVCHAMSTVATGGLSTHDASFGFWDSPLLDGIAIVFMLLGAINFGLHWYAWRRATVAHYQSDSELRMFLTLIAIATVVIGLANYGNGHFATVGESLRRSLFQVVSHITTSGFASNDFAQWPGMAPLALLMLAFVGGCAGSTTGGIKMARVQMVVRQGLREIKQLVHPKGQFVVTLGGKRVSESVVISVAGFCTLYVLSFLAVTLGLAASGMDEVSAFSAAAAMINNLGPGLGQVAWTARELNDGATWLCTFAMILGRLEVFTVLVLLSPRFWRE
jgi:trk system potassium uptake protein TrkH